MDIFRHFPRVWLVAFSAAAIAGEKLRPLCVAAREVRTGQSVRRCLTGSPGDPIVPTDSGSLFVSYDASVELGCHIALGWPIPVRILDLHTEFRNLSSGLKVPCGYDLMGALTYFGLDSLAAVETRETRGLVERGGPFTEHEQRTLLDGCQRKVDCLAKLLGVMLPLIDLPRALLRGRYMAAVARIERNGVPMDAELLNRLRTHWKSLKRQIAEWVHREYGVFPPGHPSFAPTQFETYLGRSGILWPRQASGELDLGEDAFKEMSRAYPHEIGPIREVLHFYRGQLDHIGLTAGTDGRNRYRLCPFASKTGRNQPSNKESIFSPSTWLRSLIRPEPGQALAYIDWSAQELGIAAALSGDRVMMAAYSSGDPFLWFAKRAGAVPASASKSTNLADRERFKLLMLGILNGMSATGIAGRLCVSTDRGRELLELHRATFPEYWRWADATEIDGILSGKLRTVFGWELHVGAREPNPRSLRNFPLQGNGAEMLRLACCLATERGINVCAPVHDALLVEGTAAEIDEVVAQTQMAMSEASEIVLAGFRLRTDARIVRFPDRYIDERGRIFFRAVLAMLEEIDPQPTPAADGIPTPTAGGMKPVPRMVDPPILISSPSSLFS